METIDEHNLNSQTSSRNGKRQDVFHKLEDLAVWYVLWPVTIVFILYWVFTTSF